MLLGSHYGQPTGIWSVIWLKCMENGRWLPVISDSAWVTRFHYTSTCTCTLFNLSSMLCMYMKFAICLQSNQLWCSLIDRDLPLYRTLHVQGKEPLPGWQEQWHHNDITSIYSANCTNNGATYTCTLYMCTHPFKYTHTHTHTYIVRHLMHPS